MLGRPKIQDARGRTVKLVRPQLFMFGLCPKDREERLRGAGFFNVGAGRRNAPATRDGLPLLAVMVGAIALAIASDFSAAVFLAFTPLLGVLLSYAVIMGWYRNFSSQIAHVYLRAKYCASCGHDLTGSELTQTGITTCPECAAEWRMDGALHVGDQWRGPLRTRPRKRKKKRDRDA